MTKEYFEAISHESLVKMAVVLAKKDAIFTDILKEISERTCGNCKYGNAIENNTFICSNAVCQDINEIGQYITCEGFGCNKWEAIKCTQ